jgi:hypothetical protein
MPPDPIRTPPRTSVIAAVKTYLGFFVLVVLVVELALGTLAATTEGTVQLLALGGMLFVISGLVAIVSFFAYRRPEVLLRSLSQPGASNPTVEDDRFARFRSQICGYWWDQLEPPDPHRLGVAHIFSDPESPWVRFEGTAYDPEGHVLANWESVATCLNVTERKLFYYWRGNKPLVPGGRFEGFGEISFQGTGDTLHSAKSMFSDANLAQAGQIVMKQARLWRVSEEEAETLSRTGRPGEIARLVRKRFEDT